MKEGRESNVRVTSEREEGKKRIEGEGQREGAPVNRQADRQTVRQTGGGGDEKDEGVVLGGKMEGKFRQLSLYMKGFKRWVYRIGLYKW